MAKSYMYKMHASQLEFVATAVSFVKCNTQDATWPIIPALWSFEALDYIMS